MKKILSLLITALLILCSLTVPVFADGPVEAVIPVIVTDECKVELRGISDNTNGYCETGSGSKNIEFRLSFDEPGEYRYELRQVKDGTADIYDETIYDIWVSVLYEDGVMRAGVTGGIHNTDDKPDEFKFGKESSPEKEFEFEKVPPKTVTNVKTGDSTNTMIWMMMLIVSAAAVIWILKNRLIPQNDGKRRKPGKGVSEYEKK